MEGGVKFAKRFRGGTQKFGNLCSKMFLILRVHQFQIYELPMPLPEEETALFERHTLSGEAHPVGSAEADVHLELQQSGP
jgi:hypothetical protein